MSKCDDPNCPGWAFFNNNEIQRCDTCNRFRSDAGAVEHVRNLLEDALALAQYVSDELAGDGMPASAKTGHRLLKRADQVLKLARGES
jgi:hypothetical protein